MAVKKKTSSPTIADRIKPLENSTALPVVAALLYGNPGTGKTTVLSTFPKPILLIDIREKGSDPIRNVKGVEKIDVLEWDDMDELYWHVKKNIGKYKTVALDTVTQLQGLCVEAVREEEGKKDNELLSRKQWGEISTRMKQTLDKFRDLIDDGINVVFTAHTRSREGLESEDGELSPEFGPMLMPSVASHVGGSVKVLGNTMIREVTTRVGGKIHKEVAYSMRVGPHAYFITKIRALKGSFVPAVIDDPDYKKIVAVMNGEAEPPEEPAKTQKVKNGNKG